jgi:hypothetical protein
MLESNDWVCILGRWLQGEVRKEEEEGGGGEEDDSLEHLFVG